MAFPDARGNPCSSASTAAREAVEQALWRMLSFHGTPLADLDTATAADPGWALPHLMRAGWLAGLTEPGQMAEAAAELAQARALQRHATAPERSHLAAVQAVLEGRWHAACRTWDDLLLDHPRDALALHWAQAWDIHRGDATGLRQRPARALPEWDEDDPLYACVLAQYAFGLQECNLYPQAEEVGRRALALDPRQPWAVHAVAHVMEMQGRYEEGAAWLRQQQPMWAEGSRCGGHLWWHKALFRLEALDTEGALRLLDGHLAGAALQTTLLRMDAASLLWRLGLLDEDVTERATAVLAGWALGQGTAGHHAFNDLHAVLALLAAGQTSRAEAWVARCAERALDPADAGRTNHLMAREVGLPLMRGLLALARGDADGAADLIAPVRNAVARLGGSQVQHDLIDQTLLAAAARGGRRALGRALVNERCLAKPITPLTRHWMDRLAIPPQSRA
jgi:hypothetical protein